MELKDYPILISLFALLVSISAAIYNYGLAKINVLHSIQKLMLDKAKDCNQIYETSMDKYVNRYVGLGYDPPKFNYSTVISEIVTSVELLDNSLNEFSQNKKRNFFLKQFWVQINPSIRSYFGEIIDVHGMTEVTKQNVNSIKDTFIPLFK